MVFAFAQVGCAPCLKPAPTSCPRVASGPRKARALTAKPRPRCGRRSRRYVHPDRADRLALFARLVRVVRARHVFAAQTVKNLNRRWSDDLPNLRREFAAAKTRLQLSVALTHLANSLHNPHCHYNTSRRPIVFTAGFDVDVAWSMNRGNSPFGALGEPVFYVTQVHRPELKRRISVGDRVVQVDGVAAASFMRRFINESNGNNWRRIGLDIARYLTRRKSMMSNVMAGAQGSWVLIQARTKKQYSIRALWRREQRSNRGGNPLDLDDPQRCYNYPRRRYGPYRLAARGINFCLYTSPKQPFRHYPIVRQVSFHYHCGKLRRCLVADQGALRRLLKRQQRVKGVILDLRDNGGGNNPNWFLDWWAPKPYLDHFVRYLFVSDLLDKSKLRKANITGWRSGSGRMAWYLAQLKKHRGSKKRFAPAVPFFCLAGQCQWSNRYTPGHRVTRAPVALLVGPRCVSSCDHVAMIFSENRFGPIVGRPTAAGYTGYRSQHHLRIGKNRTWFGFLGLAFSYEVSGKTRQPVEGVQLKIDQPVEKTIANHERYDALLVQGAIKALSRQR